MKDLNDDSVESVVLPRDLPFKIVTGEVYKDGAFILAEEGTDSLHIGWWCEVINDWTIEPKEEGYGVGNLTPLAKIIRRLNSAEDESEGNKESDPIGVSDGNEGVISFCCSEGRHAECTGVTEAALSEYVQVQCVCPCHDLDG